MKGTHVAAAILCASIALLAGSPGASAQDFPTRPVTLIVPWPPGGATDRHLRALAEATTKHLGQPITIENRPGASGTIGAATLASSAKPDGYTISQLPVTALRLPYMQKVAFDPTRDFTYIIHVTGYTFGTTVKADSPWKNWKEFLAYAKANPGKVKYGTPGTGTTLHITMEQIAKQHGIKWTQVPFKGEAESTAALLGGHIDAVAGGTGIGALVDAGEARMLVVWTPERSSRFPNVPTLVEEGDKIISTSPYGIAGPKGMDPKVVKILHDAFKKGMDEESHKQTLTQLSQPIMYMGPEEYAKFATETIAEQRSIIEDLGLGQKQ